MADIELIKQKLNIVDVVSKYIQLQKAGAYFKAPCPFHNEKTPSFMVNPSLQIYKCFGCGKGGDVIKFIQEYEKLDFIDALKKAAELAGVEVNEFNKEDPAITALKQKIYRVNDLTHQFFYHILTSHKVGEAGRIYAEKRKLTKNEIELFKFGYAPNGYDNLKRFLLGKGFTVKDLISAGVIVQRDKDTIDKYRNRLMQPLFDTDGKVIGFSGRYIGTSDMAPKYLNSPDTIVYHKHNQLYSLFHAKEAIRKTGFAIVVEGNLDVVSSFRAGVKNIVAPLGTALTSNQALLLKRYADTIYFSFDTDDAGIHALERGIEIAENVGLKHMVVDIGAAHDVDDLVSLDPKMWIEAVKNPVESLEYLKKFYTREVDMGSAKGKSYFQSKFLPVLKNIKDPVLRNHYIKQASLLLEITIEDVESLIKNEQQTISKPETNMPLVPKEALQSTEELEKFLLAAAIQKKWLGNKLLYKLEFSDLILNELQEVLAEVKSELDPKITESLSDEVRKTYADLIIMELPQNLDKKDIQELCKRLYKSQLNSKVLALRTKLSLDDEDQSAIKEMQQILLELKKLNK